jgi:uncharacterized protein YfiM (DUF2279 family)
MLALIAVAGGKAIGEKRGVVRKPATKSANLRKRMKKNRSLKAGKEKYQSRHADR